MSSPSDQPTTSPAPGGADETPGASADPGGSASLDKVRDILFGAQSRDYDRRFSRLEERLAKDASDLREDVRKRLEVLEAFVRRESESLVDRVTRERDDRLAGANDLSREIKDAAQAQAASAAQFDERLSKEQRDVRQQLLDQYNRLSEDIRQKADDLLAAIAREANELRNEKVGRAALASLLSEMAMRLNHEFTIPGHDEQGD